MPSDITSERIYLSPPHMGGEEIKFVQEAFDSNWIAPVGPHIRAFEDEFAASIGRDHCVALSSATAALHIALKLCGVQPGDEVLCSDLTFVASANPIVYESARPVFIDSETTSWNMDPDLLARTLEEKAKAGRLPKAVVVVDLYGQCADYGRILPLCAEYGVPVIQDAAESLGAEHEGKPAGNQGLYSVFSFNGNKIITTSGGGMLVCPDAENAAKAKHLGTQAREPARHYEHRIAGYNYRMSNVLAGIGRGQLKVLRQRVEARRSVFDAYREALAGLPIAFQPEAPWGRSTRWLTCALLDEGCPVTVDALCDALEQENVEARPLWKPMHTQPLFKGAEHVCGGVAKDLFARGVCLPSGSQLSPEAHNRVTRLVKRLFRA